MSTAVRSKTELSTKSKAPPKYQLEPLDIPDVCVLTPRVMSDARGFFVETYNRADFAALGIDCEFVQDNQSKSVQPGTLRGLHFQSPPFAQAKLVRVLAGAVFDVAVDLRANSKTYGRWCGVTLSADNFKQIFIPRGFAHGFCSLEPNTVLAYKVDNFYSAECDDGIHWGDPDIGISWPVDTKDIFTSDKDKRLRSIRQLDTPFVV